MDACAACDLTAWGAGGAITDGGRQVVPGVAIFVLCLAGGLAMATRRAPLWLWSLALAAITFASQTGLFEGRGQRPALSLASLAGWATVLIFGALCLPPVRP